MSNLSRLFNNSNALFDLNFSIACPTNNTKDAIELNNFGLRPFIASTTGTVYIQQLPSSDYEKSNIRSPSSQT